MDASDGDAEVEQIREIERRRLRALVEADVGTASDLHANDFQLINPSGRVISKDDYMNGIASGQIHYRVWEPISTIEVRQVGRMAVIRYQSRLEITVAGRRLPLREYWHTDSYEKLDDRWQVVWSQATEIQ